MTLDRKKRPRRIAADEAHAWARNLKLGNIHAKLILSMLTLYVDHEGVAFVAIPSLAEDCELSADTVRRRLAWLEGIGAITRLPQWIDENGNRNGAGRGKRTTDLIRLRTDVDPDVVEARAAGHVAVENEAETSIETEEISPSCQQGLNPVSPAPALGQPSHCGKGLISEPEPEESPQPPSGGRSGDALAQEGSEETSELFAFLKTNYPDSSRWPWAMVLPLFAGMSLPDQRKAAAASPEYGRTIATTKPKPAALRPERFLKQRIFDNYPHAKLPEKPVEQEPPSFHPVGSEVCNAMSAACRIARIPFEPRYHGGLSKGVLVRGEPGADFLRIAELHSVDVDELPFVAIEGTQEFAAWRERLRRWTGVMPDARKIWTEAHDPEIHDLPYTHPKHRFRKHVKGLRVPWEFPPLKDGSLSPPKAKHEALANEGQR